MTAVRVFRIQRNPKLAPTVSPRRVAAAAIAEMDPAGWRESWTDGFTGAAIDAAYQEIGISEFPRPNIEPTIPEDPTVLTSEELGLLYAQFVAFSNWVEQECSRHDMFAAEMSAKLDHVEAEVRLRKSGTVKDKDMKTSNDPRFTQTQQEALVAEARAKMLKARLRSLERASNALSREITRRTGMNDLA